MKISVCIPVYQSYVTELVNEIVQQAESALIKYEVLLVDDASTGDYQRSNRSLAKNFEQVEYHQLPKNVGRSKIRNILAGKSTGDYCLFMDSDVHIHKTNFLQEYIHQLNEDSIQLIAGGCKYKMNKQAREGKQLRYKYGKFIEEITIGQHGKITSPFLGCNFLVNRAVFHTVRFNEHITQYGFEDLLFALEFEKHFGEYQLIDNPVSIQDVDENVEYLRKTISSMKNLAILYHQKKLLPENQIRLLLVYEELKKKNLVNPFYAIAKNSLPVLLMNLNSANPSLKVFQFFKLIHFIEAILDLES